MELTIASKSDMLEMLEKVEAEINTRFDHVLAPRVKTHSWLPEGLNKRAGLVSVRIGHGEDLDYILLNGTQQFVAFRGPSENAHECYLDDGTPAKLSRRCRSVGMGMQYVAIVKFGTALYERYLQQGEFIWFTEQAFDRAFYPIVYEDDHEKQGRWRIPLDSYQAALNYKVNQENKDA